MVNTKRGVTEYPSFRNSSPYGFAAGRASLSFFAEADCFLFYFTPGESNIKAIRDEEAGWA
jgi:hypothetical protein